MRHVLYDRVAPTDTGVSACPVLECEADERTGAPPYHVPVARILLRSSLTVYGYRIGVDL